MRYERIGQDELIRTDNRILGGNPVGIVNARIVLSDEERDHVRQVSERVISHICSEQRYMEGFVRIDFVPKFSSNGGLELVGVLEVNGHGLECVGAASALGHAYPDMVDFDTPAVFAQYLQEKANGRRIIFLPGLKSSTKRAWQRLYFRDLKRVLGDQIECWSEKRFRMQSQCVRIFDDILIYRWGDCRPWPGGVCEFSTETCRDLIALQDSGVAIINPVWSRDEDDPSSKRQLVSENSLFGGAFILADNSIEQCLMNKDRLVLKATGSGAGNGVVCGKDVDDATWRQDLRRAISSGSPHIVQEYMELPTLEVFGTNLVMDFNAMGWVDSSGFTYVGFIARAATPDRYIQAGGRINVSLGGGTGFFPLGR